MKITDVLGVILVLVFLALLLFLPDLIRSLRIRKWKKYLTQFDECDLSFVYLRSFRAGDCLIDLYWNNGTQQTYYRLHSCEKGFERVTDFQPITLPEAFVQNLRSQF